MPSLPLPLEIPAPGAPRADLIQHFRLMNSVLASFPYDRAIHLCHTCGREGENICGKADNPAGRNRYCSEACEALARRHRGLPFKSEGKQKETATDVEDAHAREAAPEPARPAGSSIAGEGELPHDPDAGTAGELPPVPALAHD